MRFLRTASTRRLLAAFAGLIIAIAAGTAIAVAAGSGSPTPKRQPLANAIHQALSAPAVQGISAKIKFTNGLISSSNVQGSDPILTGATGRLWLSNDHRLRLELQSSGDGNSGQDAEVVVDKTSFWVYDPMANTVYRGTIPAHPGAQKQEKVPTVAQIQSQINQVLTHLNVAGRPRGTSRGKRPTPYGSRRSTTAACSAPFSSGGTHCAACHCGSGSTLAGAVRRCSS